MAVEAAVMGVPSIRCNTFARRCSVLLELEHRYDLTYAYLPSEEDAFFQKINLLLDQTDLLPQWKQKRECMLQDKIDLTAWMVDFIENLDS
jgi:uncharacterized protein